MHFKKYGFAMMALFLSAVIMSSHVLGGNGQGEEGQVMLVDADTLIAGVDDYVGKRIETIGNIVHICGVNGMKMKMMTAGGAKIKIVPADGVTPFDADAYNGKSVRVRGVVREFRLDNKYIEGIEREHSLLCHVDHTPCLSKSWTEKARAAGTADSLSAASTNKLREKVAAAGKGYISLLTIEAERCEVVEDAEKRQTGWDWQVSTPDEQGLDGKALAELADRIRAGEICPNLHALLVIRHGVLVLERYYNGWKRDDLHTLQSVSKSFTSALVGIAIARGEFKGVDEKILDFFPDMKDIANMDERKASMRLEDLLTMRTGTDYHEQGPDSPHFQLNRLGKGWDKFYLDRPMVREPGTAFQYDSGGVILISAMLKNRTGMHALQYAKRHLFEPLGIETYFWFANLEGHSHAGGGLNLKARDTAKLGQLYLDKGRWGDAQLVPEEWVRESCSMHVNLAGPGKPPSGYGYLWWIGAPDPRGEGRQYVSMARGRFGQFIFIAPEHDMVVVILSVPKEGDNPCNYMSLFYDQILTTVRR